MDTDASRRDFTINSLYYDVTKSKIIDWHNSLEGIHKKVICPIGEVAMRFAQDPVRMLRAIRFMTKLGFSLDPIVIQTIHTHKHLLRDIPPARLFEECIKLFSSINAYANYKALIEYNIFSLLFPYTKDSVFIKEALLNTEERLKKNLSSSPAFMFAVFLFDTYRDKFAILAKTYKNKKKASEKTIREIVMNQAAYVQIPQFLIEKVINTWTLQYKLECAHTNYPYPKKLDKLECAHTNYPYPKKLAKKLLRERDFRMAYDFLSIRSKIDSELVSSVEFWHKIQYL